MTNKSLSQQICEVCGIEPQIIEDYELNDIELYPDFENNNNNFVKLLNTHTDYFIKENNKIPSKPIWWIINKDAQIHNQLSPYSIEICLIRLLLILKNENNEYTEEEIKKIKQAIKNEQWEV